MKTEIIGQRILDIVVEEMERLYPQFMKRVNNIDIDYFDDITCDSEELPKELSKDRRNTLKNNKNYPLTD